MCTRIPPLGFCSAAALQPPSGSIDIGGCTTWTRLCAPAFSLRRCDVKCEYVRKYMSESACVYVMLMNIYASNVSAGSRARAWPRASAKTRENVSR